MPNDDDEPVAPPNEHEPAAPLKGVLLDVGGTLWRNSWPPEMEVAARLTRLGKVLPALSEAERRDLMHRLRAQTAKQEERYAQDTGGAVRAVLGELGLPSDPEAIWRVWDAMVVPARGHVDLFPGGREMLAWVKEHELRCVVVSNTVWRTALHFADAFTALGVGGCFDAYIASVDIGWRKPHRAMFDAAVAVARCAASECVMIGNTEEKDVAPALALGMRAIRTAIEGPPPKTSAAHAVVTTLADVPAVLAEWIAPTES